jgi:hypothetical protein
MGACNPGFADCNNSAADGCEVSLSSDAKNCSKCGMVCPANMAYCSMGGCVVAPTLAGSFNVHDGPVWTTNPPCYSCQEACAKLFGGLPGDYSCSIVMNMVTHTAYASGYGDGTHCNANPFSESYKLNTLYDCGVNDCSYSAFVSDNCFNSINYCFK